MPTFRITAADEAAAKRIICAQLGRRAMPPGAYTETVSA
jgi:hypothetical protein